MAATEVTAYAFPQLERSAQIPAGAEDILSAAWAEAEQVREHARREGEAIGRAEGLADARAEVTNAIQTLGAAARSIEELRAELIGVLESQAAELALRLAEQIMTTAVAIEPARVLDITRAALRRLVERHRVTIIVNPDDLELVSSSAEPLRQELGGIEHFDVQADRRIERGGALVRTDYGELDATLAAQLQSAREIVMRALSGDDLDVAEPADDD